MKNYYYVLTHGTGDGMEPTCDCFETKAEAVEHALIELPPVCEDCGGGEEDHDEDEDHEFIPDEQITRSRRLVAEWNGEGSLEVDYYDGNMGYLVIGHKP